jgi:hypothetical protein
MVFQYDCDCGTDREKKLARISQAHHERYAAAHGYTYKIGQGTFLPKDENLWRGDGHLNKIYGVLLVLLEELGKQPEDRVEWIA